MTPRPTITVERIDTMRALAALATEWAALAGKTPEATGFQHPDWCLSWVEANAAVGADVRPRVLALREDGRLAMLWPLQIERRFGARIACWLGEPMTQYGDALAMEGDRAGWLDASRAAFAEWRDVDLFAFTNLREDGVIAPLGALGARIVAGPAFEAPFVVASQPMRRRKSMARRAQRLQAIGDVALCEAQSPQAREALAGAALAFKRRWLRRKGAFSAGLSHPATEAFVRHAAGKGALRVSELQVGGETAAIELGFVGGGAYRSFMSAYDEKFAAGAPGQELTRRVIERCAAEGLSGYDMLAPADPHKREWTECATRLRTQLAPTGWRGWLAAFALAKLRPLAKRVVKALSGALAAASAPAPILGKRQKAHKLAMRPNGSREVGS